MPMCMPVFHKLDQLASFDRLELIHAFLFKHLNQMQMMCKYRLSDPNQVAGEKKYTIAKKH